MDFLSYFQLSSLEIYYIIFIVFIASIIRGFNGFGFSATCISGFSFIFSAIEIVPIILIFEVFISIFMVPYVWNKIDWNFVFKVIDWNCRWITSWIIFIKISFTRNYSFIYILNNYFFFTSFNERLHK